MAITALAFFVVALTDPSAPSLPSPAIIAVVPTAHVAPEPMAEVPVKLDVAEQKPQRKRCYLKGKYVDILAHAGITLPDGKLFDDAQVGPLVGGGVSKELVLAPHSAVRASLAYNYARLSAKQADRDGHLTVHAVWLRADYLLGHARVRPFAGIGIGFYPWRGGITNKTSLATHSQKTIDLGGTAAIGADIRVCGALSVAPELSYTRIGGHFSDNLWGAQIAARWSL